MRTITREIVSALIFSKDDRLLMGMKDPGKGGVYADCWHIPGGGIDDGEDKLTALKREVFEEVGLDITSAHIILVDNQGRGEAEKTIKGTSEVVLCNMIFNVYRVNIDQNADAILAKPNDDLIKLEWVALSELSQYKLTPPSAVLFSRLGYLRFS